MDKNKDITTMNYVCNKCDCDTHNSNGICDECACRCWFCGDECDKDADLKPNLKEYVCKKCADSEDLIDYNL
jgi:hypothetical protein